MAARDSYKVRIFVTQRADVDVHEKTLGIRPGFASQAGFATLGIWLEQNEGAKFWLGVLTELKNRGVGDVLIACCDGLTGFPEAIEATWPKATVQTCVVHLIRNSMKYCSYKDRKKVVAGLKPIYQALNDQAATHALDDFELEWAQRYPAIVELWRRNWERFIPFLAFPAEIRKIIYTTNAIESLNSQLRKAIKTRGHFPTDDAALKLMYLAICNIGTIRGGELGTDTPGWTKALNAFAISFPGRFTL